MSFLYVLLALLIFGGLIVIHELGHFLTARLFGVGINEFSIGMGPKLLSRKGKKYDTVYSVRAFPIGGYVSMVGEDEDSDRPDAFSNQHVFKRILIVVAGPLMNIVLGFILMLILVLSTKTLASNTVGEFLEGALSAQSGLAVGDTVVEVGGVNVHTGNEAVYEIMNQGVVESASGRVTIDLTVIRNGERVYLPAVQFPSVEKEGVLFGSPDFRVFAEGKDFGSVVKHTFFRSISTVKMILDSLGDLLRGRYGFNAVSGPIGITEEITTVAKKDSSNLLYLMTVITVNLGVFNLLPLPALDGGRLLFLIVEAVRRRPLNKDVEGYIHFVGMMILFFLMILITCKDIAGLFVK